MGAEREEACAALVRQAHAIVQADGSSHAASEKIKTRLVGLDREQT
jgi:hypothetical protein